MFYAREHGSRFVLWDDEHCATLLEANDDAGFHRFLADLESDPSGHWKLAGSAAANGVRWPAFDELLRRECARYRAHPETALPLAGKPWRSEAERRDVLNRRTEIIAALQLYAPEGVMLPWYFEKEPVDLSMIQRRYGGEVDASHLKAYFISSTSGARVLGRAIAESEGASSFVALAATGLYRVGNTIPPSVMVSVLDNKELRACATALQLHPQRTKAENIVLLTNALERNPEAVGRLIRECRDWNQYVGVMPPDGVDWDTFQSMRQQAKGMIVTLRDFLGGWLLRDGRNGRARHEALRFVLPT